MITYIATFYSHYGAIQFRRNCQAMNLSAEVMPVPRDLSSSCGTCVRFHTEADFPEKTEEVEQIVRVEPQGYVGIYHAMKKVTVNGVNSNRKEPFCGQIVGRRVLVYFIEIQA